MSKNIAFISGKGGSGKTSLALAYAKALSDIELKVLLIDCDMSTHGATFFMRPYIESHKKSNFSILAVDDILNSSTFPPYGFFNLHSNNFDKNTYDRDFNNIINVEKNFYFIPSDVSISTDKNNKLLFTTFEDFLTDEASELFDIIILDCQAGYSDFTRCILRNSNITLLVTEPDSVSAAANRALCFQMGLELDSIQSYQLFSKVTNEEAIHYTKTSTSSFFTNLAPVIFDWELRRTFVYLTIPSAETVSIQFEKNILDTLLIILPEYREQIQSHKDAIHNLYIYNLEKQLEFLEYKRRKRKKLKLVDSASNALSIISLFIIGIIMSLFNSNHKINITMLIVTMLMICLFFIIMITKKTYTSDLRKIDEEILEIKEQLNHSTIPD